ncbi:MAG: site-specific integrase [Clostridia bacterium]|nr:site-specific integrase [Clostridia bacterium]
MASKVRRTYTYIDTDGKEQTIFINGVNSKDTDKKFQAFLTRQKETLILKSERVYPTLMQFIDEIYKPYFMRGLEETTKANYSRYIRLYIIPFLGKMALNAVTVAHIQSFYDWMAHASEYGKQQDLTCRTIDRVGGLTSRMFKVARELKLIEDTPFKRTLLRNNGRRSGHHKALPDTEVIRIKREIPLLEDERQRLYMGLLVYTGMRREEVLGLGWENIHLSDGYGEVRRVVTYPNNARTVVKEEPKTAASERTFIIPAPLKQLLLPFERKSGYVIHGESHECPVSCSTAQRTYNAAFKKLGILGKFNNHDWRATFGTQLKEQGLSSAIVADLLGHADTRMIETTYARARHEGIMKQRNAIEALNAFL